MSHLKSSIYLLLKYAAIYRQLDGMSACIQQLTLKLPYINGPYEQVYFLAEVLSPSFITQPDTEELLTYCLLAQDIQTGFMVRLHVCNTTQTTSFIVSLQSCELVGAGHHFGKVGFLATTTSRFDPICT